MALKNTIAVLSLIVVSAFACIAQDKNKEQKQYQDELLRQQSEENQKKLDELVAEQRKAGVIDLDFFVPAKIDAWMVSLTATGGVTGGNRLLAAINSDGNILCGLKDDAFKTRLAPADSVKTLAELVIVQSPRLGFFDTYSTNPIIKYCNDCSYEILSISSMNSKGSIRTGRFDAARLTEGTNALNSIYQKLLETAVCHE
jgi:hypothetical protein